MMRAWLARRRLRLRSSNPSEPSDRYQMLRAGDRIYRNKSISDDWWRDIIESTKDERPDSEALKKAILRSISDGGESDADLWPDDYNEIDAQLRAITFDEGAAIIGKFLLLERGAIEPGVRIYQLQWNYLCAVLCPRRSRDQVLNQLVDRGFLSERPRPHPLAGRQWPLAVTSSASEFIVKHRWQARHARSYLFHESLNELYSVFPLYVRLGAV